MPVFLKENTGIHRKQFPNISTTHCHPRLFQFIYREIGDLDHESKTLHHNKDSRSRCKLNNNGRE